MKINVKIALFKNSKDSNWLTRNVIKWWTNSQYYHAEIVIGDVWVESSGEGVHMHSLRPLKDTYDYIDVDVDVEEERYRYVMDWIHSIRGAKYDYLGILLSQVIRARIDDPNRWFCSELTTKVLQMFRVSEVKGLAPNTISPGDLAEIFGGKR